MPGLLLASFRPHLPLAFSSFNRCSRGHNSERCTCSETLQTRGGPRAHCAPRMSAALILRFFLLHLLMQNMFHLNDLGRERSQGCWQGEGILLIGKTLIALENEF